MDKKKPTKTHETDDIKGFEEFIEGQHNDARFLPKGVGHSTKKNESGFEHFTFLTNDAERLSRLKILLGEKLPFSARFDQADKLIKEQKEELKVIKEKIFEISDRPDSPYRKTLREIFDSYYEPSKGQH
jgi:hypothetical protein